MIVYGIKNCNTVKKALKWLEEANISFVFHDYKKTSISASKIEEWQKQVPWESLINKRGTTWRKLGSEIQDGIVDEESASSLMQEHTSLIKRPIIEKDAVLLLGFDEDEYQEKLI